MAKATLTDNLNRVLTTLAPLITLVDESRKKVTDYQTLIDEYTAARNAAQLEVDKNIAALHKAAEDLTGVLATEFPDRVPAREVQRPTSGPPGEPIGEGPGVTP